MPSHKSRSRNTRRNKRQGGNSGDNPVVPAAPVVPADPTDPAVKPGTATGGASCVGYCVKCRSKKKMSKCKRAKSKNNRFMMKGVCVKCGTKMNKFI